MFPIHFSTIAVSQLHQYNSRMRFGEPCGVGVDIVELARVKNIRFLTLFAEFFLTPAEMKSFKKHINPIGFIASRFAAKEAAIKAFPGFLSPHEIELQKNALKPTIRFCSPKKAKRYKALVSISHSTDYAAGYA